MAEENVNCNCPECREPGPTLKKVTEMIDAKASPREVFMTLAAAIDQIRDEAKNEVQRMLNEYTTPDNSITNAMLKAHVVDVENLSDGCVTLDKLSSEGVIEYLVRETKKRIEDESNEEIYNTET